MKNALMTAVALFASLFITTSYGQNTIKLEQVKGEFTVHSLTLAPGDYVFEISNNGIDHPVGFVITPKGKNDQKYHIKNAYVKKTVSDGESAQTNVVTLAKGEYEYFCPLNPTTQYLISNI
jgi:plastocyanin